MKTLKALFICALVGIASPVFAEGGSDRLIAQSDTRQASTINDWVVLSAFPFKLFRWAGNPRAGVLVLTP
ncbi:co-regulatory protein PtrA N-terminal domain-containing protein [Pseudomonas izuensis]|uniref:co-regulatory protein PtrA N-terminal domain-containing protein n=1 Tax=Pseudomonas izuensis TaxID=2684212 RepID=UPI00135CE67B|nr:co-regulatory protein PtrA N-terminal domain-containing protein [Pseudomonas izuensis]